MKKYRCTICGYIYDESKEKTKFEDLPEDWTCPLCGAPKSLFVEIQEEPLNSEKVEKTENIDNETEDLRELSNEEIAYIFSNLAKSCEKQYLTNEEELFNSLSKYFIDKVVNDEGELKDLINLVNEENNLYKSALEIASNHDDGGTKRVLTWASKTSAIIKVILENYQSKGLEFLKTNKIWVCDICGFVYIGKNPPEVCPVCKVPNIKIMEVK